MTPPTALVAALRLVRLLERMMFETPPRPPFHEQLQIAAFARTQAMLDGMVALEQAKSPDGIALLARAILETFAVSSYVQLGGRDAGERLVRSDYVRTKKLASTLPTGPRPFGPYKPEVFDPSYRIARPVGTERIDPFDIFTDVIAQLKVNGELDRAPWFEIAYLEVYAMDSISAHSSVNALMGHIGQLQTGVVFVKHSQWATQEDVDIRLDIGRGLVWYLAQGVVTRYPSNVKQPELDRLIDPAQGGRPLPFGNKPSP